MLEVAPLAYVALDQDGRVLDWNVQTEVLFGWRRDEALGRGLLGLVLVEDAGSTRAAVSGLWSGGVGAVDVEAVDRQGRTFVAEFTRWGVERRGGTVVHLFVQDVTARRQADRASGLWTAVVEGTSDAILAVDLDGIILTWNPGAGALFGWSARDAVGQEQTFVVPGDRLGELQETVQRLRAGHRVGVVETEWLARGGARIPVSLTLAPVCDRAGVVVAISVIARDVTEQRWLASTLDTTLTALQVSTDEARASAETTRRFLADAAHQLRTPLAGISACAETLLRGAPPKAAEGLLASLWQETMRAARLLAALLHMARLDEGQALTVAPVDVVALCTAEVERQRLLPLGRAGTLALDVEVRAAPCGPLLLDGAALLEILGNLLENARRHARTALTVVVDSAPGEVRLHVVDDGPGLPPGSQERVFERFVSCDGHGGSGLGLPIARALARAMGGDLCHDNGCFRLTLPARPAA